VRTSAPIEALQPSASWARSSRDVEHGIDIPDRGDVTLIVPQDGRVIVQDADFLSSWHSLYIKRGNDKMLVTHEPNLTAPSDEGVWAYTAYGPIDCAVAIYVGSPAGLKRNNEVWRSQYE
jgi:hypothetical protein